MLYVVSFRILHTTFDCYIPAKGENSMATAKKGGAAKKPAAKKPAAKKPAAKKK